MPSVPHQFYDNILQQTLRTSVRYQPILPRFYTVLHVFLWHRFNTVLHGFTRFCVRCQAMPPMLAVDVGRQCPPPMRAASVGTGPVPARWPDRASVPIIFKNNPHNLNNFLTTEKKQRQHPGRKRPFATTRRKCNTMPGT